MVSQLRNRYLPLWLLVCGIVLSAVYWYNAKESTSFWKSPTISLVEKAKPNAVLVMLVSPSRLNQAIRAVRNIEDRFNHRLKYPYVIITEANITDEVQQKINWITEGRAMFADLSPEMWGPPDFLEQERIDASLNTIGFSMGYRAMCRFYSGFFWKHPAVAQYEWIWRLDSDIEFHCDVPYDPIVRMQEAGARYGFVQIAPDVDWVQPTLVGNISSFLSTHKHLLPPGTNQRFVWRNVDKALEGTAGNDEWTRYTFYNNWEISHRSLWQSELYTSLFEHLDRAGGFFYERWSDAPIHSFGVAMSLRTEEVMQFTDMGYEHQHWAFECPDLDRCTCVRDAKAIEFGNRGWNWFNSSRN